MTYTPGAPVRAGPGRPAGSDSIDAAVCHNQIHLAARRALLGAVGSRDRRSAGRSDGAATGRCDVAATSQRPQRPRSDPQRPRSDPQRPRSDPQRPRSDLRCDVAATVAATVAASAWDVAGGSLGVAGAWGVATRATFSVSTRMSISRSTAYLKEVGIPSLEPIPPKSTP